VVGVPTHNTLTVAPTNDFTLTVSSATATTTVCTIVTAETHNLFVGQKVTVASVSSRFNDTVTVASVNAGTKTFTYAKSGTAVTTPVTTGTVTVTSIASAAVGYPYGEVTKSSTQSSLDVTYRSGWLG